MTMKTPALFSRPVSRRAVCLGLGAATISAATGPTHAATEWPIRPVTVVVPYAPGGNTDMMARLSSQYLASKLGQPFVIENRAGGGGAVGAIGVARAQPDGYTLLFGASTQLVNIPMLQKVVYSHRDFTPISIFGAGPYLLGIKSTLPVKTLKEFIDYVKARPGQLNYGTAGIGGNVHLNTALFLARAGLDMIAIPYKSGAPAMAGLVAGEVEMYFGNASELMLHTETKSIKDPRDLHATADFAATRHPRGRRNVSGIRHLLLERLPGPGGNADADPGEGREARHRRGEGARDHPTPQSARDPAVRHHKGRIREGDRAVADHQPRKHEGSSAPAHGIGCPRHHIPPRHAVSGRTGLTALIAKWPRLVPGRIATRGSAISMSNGVERRLKVVRLFCR